MATAENFRRLVPLVSLTQVEPPADIGRKPDLKWLPLSALVVDERYQRAIGRQGRPNVFAILAHFDWNKFSPLVVTQVGAGVYAIIDGQHHATAALMHPQVDEVPCYVVDVTPDEAAACFAAINGQVTSITNGQIWKAKLMAGDTNAKSLHAVLMAAGVSIMPYKLPNMDYRVGETLAVRTLELMMQKFGADVLTTALQAITQTGNGNAGCITAPAVKAMCEIVKSIDVFVRRPTMLFALMDEVDFPKVLAETAVTAKRDKSNHASVLQRLLADYLLDAMRTPG